MLAIRLAATSYSRRDLDECRGTAVFRVAREKFPGSVDALRQALRVVEPVDSQQQAASRVFLAYPSKHLPRFVRLGESNEIVEVDADRVGQLISVARLPIKGLALTHNLSMEEYQTHCCDRTYFCALHQTFQYPSICQMFEWFNERWRSRL